MYKSSWGKWLAPVACLLGVSLPLPTALAGSISLSVGAGSTGGTGGAGGPSVTPIDGEYTPSLISNSSTGLSVALGQPDAITSPSQITAFHPSGLIATSHKDVGGTKITLGNSTGAGDLILTGQFHPQGPTTTIEYTWSSASLSASGNTITADVTRVRYTNPISGINPPNPGLLTIIFEPLNGQQVNFEPSYPPGYDGQVGIVAFGIDPVPEPGSLVHLTWLGIAGIGLLWRRQRNASRRSSEQFAALRV